MLEMWKRARNREVARCGGGECRRDIGIGGAGIAGLLDVCVCASMGFPA